MTTSVTLVSRHKVTWRVLQVVTDQTNGVDSTAAPFFRMCQTFFFIEDKAEILSKKEINGKNIYYIHYEDCE